MNQEENYGYITPNNPQGLPVKRTKHPALIAILTGAAFVLFTVGCAVLSFVVLFNLSNDVKEKDFVYQEKYSFIIEEAKEQMENHNMSVTSIHPAERYKEINEVYDDYLSKGDSTIILGYYWLLGKDETEKVLQANGYLGWNDYLIRCGATTIKGKPSFSIWKGYMFKELDLRHGDKAVSETTIPLFD